ncbi:MAG: aminotransferase class I/II-fold pyridoxal phosphate-dependent enzyme [Patescibacteria group bacterium]|jgi:dTDP-4-amino-4,6-dideoxygalactose transaminase
MSFIFTGFSPNLTGRNTLKALGWICLPWKWKNLAKGENVEKAERELKKYFGLKQAVTFDSGRSALYFALKALEIKEGDEVLVQAYTCVVVANAIRWTGAMPVYVDVGDDFNMDVNDLEKKITPRVKVVIIQHTYGLPAELEKIIGIARKHGLKIIEDCAHSFGARHNEKLTGVFGDIGMLSFGSDKILSCVRGGALVTDNPELGQKLEKYQSGLKPLAVKDIIRHLLHFPVFYLGKPLYGVFVGKAILWLAKNIYLVNRIITRNEKQGERDSLFSRTLPNALADILLGQLKEVGAVNEQRKKIAALYDSEISAKIKKPLLKAANKDECVYLRYPILIDQPKELMNYAKKHKIILGDWYNAVIAPRDSAIDKSGYTPGACPNAEKLAARIVNLPTGRNMGEGDARRVVKVVNQWINKKSEVRRKNF